MSLALSHWWRHQLLFTFSLLPAHSYILFQFVSFTVKKLQEEGKYAIDSPGSPNQFDIPPEDYALRKWSNELSIEYVYTDLVLSEPLGEHEQRAVIDPQSINDPEMLKLQRILIDWINDELAEQRIIVQQLEEDMYDGQVLHKLWEKLTGKKLDVPEVTQSEQGQHEKLNIVLKAVNHVSQCRRTKTINLANTKITYIARRPLASIRKYPNGRWLAFTPRTLLPYCICWLL